MSINNRGRVEEGTTVSELIHYLKGHVNAYGDTRVIFMINGEEDTSVQFEHYKNALTINLEEI